MRNDVLSLAALLAHIRILASSAFQTNGNPKGRWLQNAGTSRGSREDRMPCCLFSTSSSGRQAEQQVYQVTIEYCTGCRWGLRSFWMAQELLNTFNDEPGLEAVTLLPSRPPAPGGEFVVQCYQSSDGTEGQTEPMTLWNRKENGGFPEITELKQLVRDKIDPNFSLGHGDTKERRSSPTSEHDPLPNPSWTDDVASVSMPTILHNAPKPSVSISYCTGCRWLLRAAWYAQELLSTFETEINSISLIPCRPPTKGGCFVIAVDNAVVWDRTEQQRFPKVTEIKQVLRDVIDPSKPLGHSDNKPSAVDEISEAEAEEARKFFGVQ